MNIFHLDKDPVKAAEYMADKHVVKMCLEYSQLLCTSHWVGWQKMLKPPAELKGKNLKEWLGQSIPHPDLVPQYSMTHVNHPSAKWARECWGNYNWLVRHALALCNEYTRRYGRTIKCEAVIRWAGRFPPPLFENTNPDSPMAMTPFATAMPEIYKVQGDPVQSYRNYYHGSKVRFAKWKYTSPPPWWAPHTYHHGGDNGGLQHDPDGTGGGESEDIRSEPDADARGLQPGP
jgi:hypothetical protein